MAIPRKFPECIVSGFCADLWRGLPRRPFGTPRNDIYISAARQMPNSLIQNPRRFSRRGSLLCAEVFGNFFQHIPDGQAVGAAGFAGTAADAVGSLLIHGGIAALGPLSQTIALQIAVKRKAPEILIPAAQGWQ